jgi:flavodoxin
MKTIIVYYSFSQNNEKLALNIQAKLECAILKIKEKRKRTGFTILLDVTFGRKPSIQYDKVEIKNYDHVIFIAPIWAGKVAAPLKSFLIEEKRNIKAYSFISLCGGALGQKEKIKKELTSLVEKTPVKVAELSINDLLAYEKMNSLKHTTGYHIENKDLAKFERQIQKFLDEMESVVHS